MKPLSNQVLVLPTEKLEKIGTLYLAASAQEQDSTGAVAAIGPGKKTADGAELINMTVKVGDGVYFTPGKGVDVTVNGVRHLLISEDDILAVL